MVELVLALDVSSREEGLRLLDRLPELRWVKIGPIMMISEGPGFVRELQARGLRVFLDMKWHDIPNTVAGAVLMARGLGIRMATIHSLGGSAMLRAAAEAAGDDLELIGVTVLTSHDEADYGGATGRPSVRLLDESARLARMAIGAGLGGVTSSPLEVDRIRATIGPEPLIVVPGIRRPADAPDDQTRTAGPREVAQMGATHLVIGRPILHAKDPAATFQDFLSAIE